MTHLDDLHRIISGEEHGRAVADLIGMRMVAAEPGRVTFELDAGPQHSSPPGTLHGGILCDLADAAMGCANLSRLEDGRVVRDGRAEDQLPQADLGRAG